MVVSLRGRLRRQKEEKLNLDLERVLMVLENTKRFQKMRIASFQAKVARATGKLIPNRNLKAILRFLQEHGLLSFKSKNPYMNSYIEWSPIIKEKLAKLRPGLVLVFMCG